MKKSAKLTLGIITLLALTSFGVVYAVVGFTLTASSNITVSPPTVSANFISGSISNEATPGLGYVLPHGFQGEGCTVGSAGQALSCPSFSIQEGDYVVFTAVVQNTGTITAGITVTATPANSGVTSIVSDPSNPTFLTPGENGTYIFTITALQVGNSGFTVTLSGTQE